MRFIHNLNEWTGKIISLLIFPLIVVIIYEVVMRYFLLQSQLWVPEISVFLFGAFFVLGGGYALLHKSHARLDVLYNRFSPRTKAIMDIATSVFFFFFFAVLIWKGSVVAWHSMTSLERSQSAFAPLLFPIKMTIPLGAALFMLQGIVKLIADAFTAIGRKNIEY